MKSNLRVLGLFMLIVRTLDCDVTVLCILVIAVELKYLRVSDECLFGLAALFVENTQVIPHFTHLRVQSRGLDDVFKGVSVVASVIVEYGEGCPVYSFTWVLISGLLEVLQGILVVFKSHETTTKDVEGIGLCFVFLFSLPHEFDCLVDVTLQKV